MTLLSSRRLLAVHRWCSIVVSLNFVLLALSGLVLVFHEEIDGALGVVPAAATGAGRAMTVADAVDLARGTTPNATAVFVFRAEESPGVLFVGFAEGAERMRVAKTVAIDLHRRTILPKVDPDATFTRWVLRLHAELFLGVPGRLGLGILALALVVSLVTGLVVYGPTMRRFSFAQVRRDRSRRTLFADLHKLLGAVTFGWNLVVTSTGALLCFSGLVFQLYAATELKTSSAAFASDAVVTDLHGIDAAITNAEAAEPGRTWVTVALPGSGLSSARHFSVLLRGGTGLESHMLGLVMVDALAPGVVVRKTLPLYLRAVLLSEPLHFGNYGGLPLKLLWSLFTLVTLGLALSGAATFVLGRGRRRSARPAAAATA